VSVRIRHGGIKEEEMDDKYADAVNALSDFLEAVFEAGILMKEDVLREVENVFGE